MGHYLTDNIMVDVIQAGIAAGQATTASDNIDMSGWDGVLIIGSAGTITGSGTATLTVGQAATDTTPDALTSAEAVFSTSTDSNKIVLIDILHPLDRYIGTSLVTATANVVWNGTLALRYRGRAVPTTMTSGDMADTLVQLLKPAEA